MSSANFNIFNIFTNLTCLGDLRKEKFKSYLNKVTASKTVHMLTACYVFLFSIELRNI